MAFLYKQAGDLIFTAKKRPGSVRSICLADSVKNKPATLALVAQVIKHEEMLEKCARAAAILQDAKGFSKHMVLACLYDFLFGKGVKGGGRLKRLLVDRKETCMNFLQKIAVKKGTVLRRVECPTLLSRALQD